MSRRLTTDCYSGTNLAAPPGVGVASVSPYQMVDWTSLGYSLPAPMYATL